VLAALAALVVPAGYTALLGVVPLGLGIRALGLRSEVDDEANGAPRAERSARSQTWTVAGVTVANGGDNLAVYIPLFASAPATIPVYVIGFAVLTVL
jgi:cadmium resistance protein CadD (predicted permease)